MLQMTGRANLHSSRQEEIIAVFPTNTNNYDFLLPSHSIKNTTFSNITVNTVHLHLPEHIVGFMFEFHGKVHCFIWKLHLRTPPVATLHEVNSRNTAFM